MDGKKNYFLAIHPTRKTSVRPKDSNSKYITGLTETLLLMEEILHHLGCMKTTTVRSHHIANIYPEISLCVSSTIRRKKTITKPPNAQNPHPKPPTWRIIPFDKWLITMVRKPPKKGCSEPIVLHGLVYTLNQPLT